MITKFKKLLAVAILALSSMGAMSAQSLWYAGRSDYSGLYTSIKAKKPIKVMHIGDSHINKGHTSAPIRSALLAKYGSSIDFIFHGINGSTYASWTQEQNMDIIVREAPDLLIVSLGTNDSYSRRFSADGFRASIVAFLSKLRSVSPATRVVLTTPPACYLRESRSRVVGYTKGKGRRGRRSRRPIYQSSTSYSFNTSTKSAVGVLNYIANAEALPIINLNKEIGSKVQAEEWLRQGLMHSDRVHFTETGYSKQGELIAKALIEGIELGK